MGHRIHSLNILVGCEFTGVVSAAFRALGHTVWSCDLEPYGGDTSEGEYFHYQGDVLSLLANPADWDMAIFHPPCTYLTSAGEWAFSDNPLLKGMPRKIKPETLIGQARWDARTQAIKFVKALWDTPIERMCIENPVGVIPRYLPDMPKPQWVQPYWFGADRSKRTGLFTRGLPDLCPTHMIAGKKNKKGLLRWANQSPCGADNTPPGPDRWRVRSALDTGMANAMADQWGRQG